MYAVIFQDLPYDIDKVFRVHSPPKLLVHYAINTEQFMVHAV